MEDENQIKTFSELTDFISGESLKMQETFGVQANSARFIKSVEKNLGKYISLYEAPLFRSVKRELKLQEAISTMPHGRLWKFFHAGLWKKIKYLESLERERLERERAEENPVPAEVPVVPPAIVVPVRVPEDITPPMTSPRP